MQITDDSNDFLQQLEWNNQLAVATSYESFQNDRYLSKIVYCFDKNNNILEYSLNILMRKDFELHDELNRFIQRMIECGLIQKWLKRGRNMEIEPSFQYINMAFKHFEFVLTLCTYMLISALCALLIETIVYKRVRAENASPFWHIIHMIINPNRYFLLEDLTY